MKMPLAKHNAMVKEPLRKIFGTSCLGSRSGSRHGRRRYVHPPAAALLTGPRAGGGASSNRYLCFGTESQAAKLGYQKFATGDLRAKIRVASEEHGICRCGDRLTSRYPAERSLDFSQDGHGSQRPHRSRSAIPQLDASPRFARWAPSDRPHRCRPSTSGCRPQRARNQLRRSCRRLRGPRGAEPRHAIASILWPCKPE